jgi:hypothetical protein
MAEDCGKYFHCVNKNDYTGLTGLLAIGIIAGALTLIEVALLIFAGSAIPYFGIVTSVLFIAAVFELCAFLHGGKLICLGLNSCVIGRIAEFIPVGQDKSGFEKMDDDFTFNIILSPHAPIETASQMRTDPNQGKFITEQSESRDLGLHYDGTSVVFEDLVLPPGVAKGHETEVLHCEIKGCRVHDCCTVLKVMSFGGPIVAAICAIPVVGWLACAIVAAIWIAIMAAAFAIAWNATHNGDINDVYDPAAGNLVAANSDTGEGGDVVLVRGDWAYDAGHSGWNEVHPVRSVQKLTDVIDPKFRGMAKASPALVAEFKTTVLDIWCFQAGLADDPNTHGKQDEPENDWDVHPDIDGCKDDDDKGKNDKKDDDTDNDDDR